jgi:hypothetical protein
MLSKMAADVRDQYQVTIGASTPSSSLCRVTPARESLLPLSRMRRVEDPEAVDPN